MGRNTYVHDAVLDALATIDRFIGGATFGEVLTSARRRAIDQCLETQSASVRVAMLHLAFYALHDDAWDHLSVPTGIRGKYGDKLLAAELTHRFVTLHNNITAFGENLGWKGNVTGVVVREDPRFRDFIDLFHDSDAEEKSSIALYLAWRFAASRSEPKALPPVPEHVLTFSRAKNLLRRLVGLQSEGMIQQFLVAAILDVHRRRTGTRVLTHHPHASDKYDRCAGDIEEFMGDTLVRAYEVTVRDDWKNRLPDFAAKMDRAGLKKYIILASNVNQDEELREPARLTTFLEPVGRDIAVVDIEDFMNVFAAELSADELRAAVNLCYDYLLRPDLCGKTSVVTAYTTAVDAWLDG